MGSVMWNANTPSTLGCKSGPWERSLLLAGINPWHSRKAGPLCQGAQQPTTGRAPGHAQLSVPVLLGTFL